jgi:ABC-type transport system involved in multi-copper enzyme maturation permease subunit
MTVARTALRPTSNTQSGSFRAVLRSEWTKLRTVRGWMIGLAVAALSCVALTYLAANGTHSGSCTSPTPPLPPGPGGVPSGLTCQASHPFVATGPDGEAVADSYEFVDRPLTGNGTVTAAVTALSGITSTTSVNAAPTLSNTRPGLAAWAKAGILLTPSTKQGSPYAAVMATGDHGVRFQYNYTHDRAGLPGTASAGTPRWLRLTRTGDTLSGYDSTDGTDWERIGTAQLGGLPPTVDVGLFVTSPVAFQGSTGYQTAATAAFGHLSLDGRSASGDWQGQSIGTSANDFYPTVGTASYHLSDDTVVVSGSGDIAPAVVEGILGTNTASSTLELGLIMALIVIIVIATMFITAEYRRGLIRTTFAATPRPGRVLAAKAIVIAAVAFVIGAVAAAAAIPLGEHILATNGNYVFPTTAATDLRIIAGSGALLAATAIAVLAIATILRKSAGAATAGIVVFVLPFIVGTVMSGGAQTWLFRLTPAASFAVLEALPRSGLVSYPYSMANGYYPLPPWFGVAVLSAYAAVALAVATFLLRRRDA